MSTPMIEKVRNATGGTLPLVLTVSECKALLAEIAPTPPRRLREWKASKEYTYRVKNGVVEILSDGGVWFETKVVWSDHVSGVADLFANPEEPVETLEKVVEKWYLDTPSAGVCAADRDKLIARLRAHLSQQTPTLTAGEHIAALCGTHGAIRRQYFDSYGNYDVLNRGGLAGEKRVSVLILPPEVSP